ncbi:MAG TPA: RNA polymerase subunit sigma-24, partial [Kribbella sp.]
MTEARRGDAAGSLAEMLDERQHLLEIALWIFGSAGTADGIVQETYRRWYGLDDDERAAIAMPRAWLTKV